MSGWCLWSKLVKMVVRVAVMVKVLAVAMAMVVVGVLERWND